MEYIITKKLDKSINLLYPLLGISKKERYRPSGTFLYWKNYTIDNYKLSVFFQHNDVDELFTLFEMNVINKLKNRPIARHSVENGTMFVFDMAEHHDTVKKFVAGKYSQYNDDVKKLILKWADAEVKDEKTPIKNHTFKIALYPGAYFDLAEDELNLDRGDLRKKGELCPIFKVEEETCTKDPLIISKTALQNL